MRLNRWIPLCLILVLTSGIALAQPDGVVPFQDVEPPSGDGELPGGTEPLGVTVSWQELTAWVPELTLPMGENLVVDFGTGRGLWLYEDDIDTWTRLTSSDPVSFVVACRKVFASFVGLDGLYLHDGTDWTRLSSWNPVAPLVPKGQTGVAINFGLDRGLWVWRCPAGLACDYLDGTTWNVVDVESPLPCGSGGGDISGATLRFRMSGDSLHVDLFEEDSCVFDDGIFVLEPDCTVSFSESFDEPLGQPFDCMAHFDEEEVIYFGETRLDASYWADVTHTGNICPDDCRDHGGSWGLPCDEQTCWPCGDPPGSAASTPVKGSWERLPRAFQQELRPGR